MLLVEPFSIYSKTWLLFYPPSHSQLPVRLLCTIVRAFYSNFPYISAVFAHARFTTRIKYFVKCSFRPTISQSRVSATENKAQADRPNITLRETRRNKKMEGKESIEKWYCKSAAIPKELANYSTEVQFRVKLSPLDIYIPEHLNSSARGSRGSSGANYVRAILPGRSVSAFKKAQ